LADRIVCLRSAQIVHGRIERNGVTTMAVRMALSSILLAPAIGCPTGMAHRRRDAGFLQDMSGGQAAPMAASWRPFGYVHILMTLKKLRCASHFTERSAAKELIPE